MNPLETLEVAEVTYAKGFPGGYVSTTDGGQTVLSLNFSGFMPQDPSKTIAFSKNTLNGKNWVEIQRELSEKVISRDVQLANTLKLDKKCLFISVLGNHTRLTLQHLTNGYLGKQDLAGELFVHQLKESIDCTHFDSAFLFSSHGSHYVTTTLRI